MSNTDGCKSEPSIHLAWASKSVCYSPRWIVLYAQFCSCPEGVRAGKAWGSLPGLCPDQLTATQVSW